MAQGHGHLQFLRIARRRWGIWRCVEWMGLCIAIGAALTLLLMPGFVWRGESSLGPAGGLMGVGAIAGVLLGITRWPSLVQTAIRADEQLRLHDLLSSVMLRSDFTDPQFHQILSALADETCAARSPSELMVRRLSHRSWGGITVLCGIVLSAAMLTQTTPRTQAEGFGEAEIVHPMDSAMRESPGRAERSREAGLSNSGSSSRKNSPQKSTPGDPIKTAPSGEPESNSSPGQAEAGGGSSITKTIDVQGSQEAKTEDAKVPELPQQSGNAAEFSPGGAERFGGSNRPTPLLSPSKHTSLNSDPEKGATSPIESNAWKASDWNQRQEAARSEIEAKHAPDEYNDVIREYFEIKN